MSTYILDVICAHQQFPGLKWAWTLIETSVNTYCKVFSECSFRGVITQLSDLFVTLVYKMIFEKDSPCMSKEKIEALINIADWYASLFGIFIQIYNMEKPPHVLPKFATYKLIMQEVSYHISVRLSSRLHWKKKAPWPTLPLRIGLYEIQNLKHVDAEIEEFKKFTFDTRSLNSYDPHCFVKDHCARVKFLWIHGVCHWVEEDSWRYCHNFLKPN